ncbi:MAG: hypothetical protein QM783_09630 [Phycisphaerales bacterium]
MKNLPVAGRRTALACGVGATSLLLAAGAARGQSPQFHGLTFTQANGYSSYHYTNGLITRDGSTAIDVGYVYPRWEVARQTAGSSSLQLMGTLPGDARLFPEDLSANGAVLVGASESSSYPNDYLRRAFRWTAAMGMQDLGQLPGHNTADALSVSGNGEVVVGISGHRPQFSQQWDQRAAFRWTAADGMQAITAPAWAGTITPNLVNFTGSVIAGQFQTDLPYGTPHSRGAFVWTPQSRGDGSFVELPGLMTGYYASVTGMNDLGTVIVGRGGTPVTGGGGPMIWRRDLFNGEWSVEDIRRRACWGRSTRRT